MLSTWIQLTICFILVCSFVQMGKSQPLLDLFDDDEQYSIEKPLFHHHPQNSAQPFKLAEPLSDEHESIYYLPLQSKSSSADHLRLAKRIIMLPRVGRRSINRKK